jgi:soluble lytic murein transglycosylase
MIPPVCRAMLVSVIVATVLVSGPSAQAPPQLAPTAHPALPASPSDYWFVPATSDRAARTTSTYAPLVDGVARFEQQDYSVALAFVTRPSLAATPLAAYASYYAGLSQLRMGLIPEARKTLDGLVERKPQGYVGVAAALAAGEAAEAAGDHRAAFRIYARLAEDPKAVSDVVLARLGRTALATNDRKAAAEALQRAYYEFPLSDTAASMAPQLEALRDQVTPNHQKDIGRAQVLFGAGRYDDAKSAFQSLQRVVSGDDKELVDLRVAECDFYLKAYFAAREGVRPYLDRASRRAEARFFFLSASRLLGARDEYIAQTEALVADFPDSSWSEEALNNLATHYIVADEDEKATDAFRRMYEKFPTGQRAERAAWKYGWSTYLKGSYAETIRVFESAAANFPRSDFRPSYLYWAGRAHARAGEGTQADARLRLVFTDYGNSYYGRLAEKRLMGRAGGLPGQDRVRLASFDQTPAVEPASVPTAALIRLLLANGLYDDALNELRYAARVSGSTPAIDATIAWVYNQRGELRRAISLMRRTYPQFLTANGDQLPPEILQIIFPLTYWDLIRKHSATYDLDPYMVAALIAQESTFDPTAKSTANARGLMQIMPATGRRLARTLGIRNFTTARLNDPETNIRLGTLNFSNVVKRFGGVYYALASYNAGESRISRWKVDRPTLDEDEFIDDIPFPETQNYVKRILGTAENYRVLYGPGGMRPTTVTPRPSAPRSSAAAKAAPKKSATPKKSTPAKKAPAKKKAPPKKTSSASH